MKKRISVTLSKDLLARIDLEIGPGGSRSAFIEKELILYFQKLERDEINARDVELINANADYLNAEMEDVLRYQADIFEILEDQAKAQ
jgi:metal-responsive CopG/Arc/MetJ family transcriptional regulator